jgi:hypothetical protein
MVSTEMPKGVAANCDIVRGQGQAPPLAAG